MRHPLTLLSALSLWVGAGVALGGCSQTPSHEPPPPPTVTVSYPVDREVTDYQDYPGRTAAVDSVQVRSRVTGYLDEVSFKDGAEVAEGAVLFKIDPRPYQAAFDAAQAQVGQNRASLQLAKENNTRFKSLAKDNAGAVTLQQLDEYQAKEDQSLASLKQAEANLETANLNLGWTKVTAPISGRTSRKLVTRGNLIAADQTVLTTIVTEDPMWVYFDADEPTVLRVQDLMRQGKFRSVRAGGKPPIFLGLATEQGYPHEGFVDFVNNQFDPATATLQVRGVFANPLPSGGERLLTPGLFVRVRVPIGVPYRALLVTAEAVGTDQDRTYLLVLDDQNNVVRRAVELGSVHGALQVVAQGLKAKERVIVNGLQHVHQGIVVTPRLVTMPGSSVADGEKLANANKQASKQADKGEAKQKAGDLTK